MIKLLHITFDMNIGGTEQVVRNLIESLDRKEFQSSLLCIDGVVGPWGQELEKMGYPVFCLRRTPGFDIKLIKEIRQLLKQHDFDILHCHQYTPYVYGLFGALFKKKIIIFTEHGRFYPDVSSLKRRIINPILQIKTSAITAISSATKDALVEYENFSNSKIEVIYNGIADTNIKAAPEIRKSLGLSDSDLVFGTISRLDPIKNHSMMIRAYAKILKLHPNIKLLIVGDGPQRAETERLITELGLSEKIILTGFQSKPQEYLALMDVFLLPSFSEGTSMTLLEAMCFGKPSIATAVGGTPEILEQDRTGLLISNNDEQALTAAMTKMITDLGLRLRLGEEARAAYCRKFTVGNMASNYEALYKRLLGI